MNEAQTRNMRTTELVPFAEQELDMLQLVLANPPAAVTELVKRVHDVAVKAEAHDALVEEYGDAIAEKLDTVKELVDLFDTYSIDNLAEQLKTLREVIEDSYKVDILGICDEIRRLRKFESQIKNAFNEALGIETI